MVGPVRDGGHIVFNSTPGCWGPMITPSIRGGQEVCRPVAVEGAEVGTPWPSGSATSPSPRWPPRRATTSRWRAASTAICTARRYALAAVPNGRRRGGVRSYAVEQYGSVPARNVDGSAGGTPNGDGRTATTPG